MSSSSSLASAWPLALSFPGLGLGGRRLLDLLAVRGRGGEQRGPALEADGSAGLLGELGDVLDVGLLLGDAARAGLDGGGAVVLVGGRPDGRLDLRDVRLVARRRLGGLEGLGGGQLGLVRLADLVGALEDGAAVAVLAHRLGSRSLGGGRDDGFGDHRHRIEGVGPLGFLVVGPVARGRLGRREGLHLGGGPDGRLLHRRTEASRGVDERDGGLRGRVGHIDLGLGRRDRDRRRRQHTRAAGDPLGDRLLGSACGGLDRHLARRPLHRLLVGGLALVQGLVVGSDGRLLAGGGLLGRPSLLRGLLVGGQGAGRHLPEGARALDGALAFREGRALA
ncbi:MAG: hypothetical protein QM765_23285 [Myxococcales bacterium]